MVKSLHLAVAAAACAMSAIGCAQAASASTFIFDTTSKTDSTTTSKNFASKATDGSSTLNMRVTAWHATDVLFNTNKDTISSAQLGLYTPGIGVMASNDSYSGNEHQIDNLDGVDFVMLQFSQNVTLASISRTVFQLDKISPSDSDAAYWADTKGAISTAANWNTAVDMTQYSVDESLWTRVAGGSSASVTAVSPNVTASVWLVGADFLGTRNDGFKLSGLSVTTPTVASVPEPASWATMLAGFGVIGGAVRRRKALATARA